MPVNRRPPGWLDNGDPDYKGTTVAERRQMQNTWDLLAEQERANQIEQEKLDFMKEQAYKKDKAEREEKESLQLLYNIGSSCNDIGIDPNLFLKFLLLFLVDVDNSDEETLKEAIRINKAWIDIQILPKEIQNLKKEKFYKYTLNITKRFKEREQYNELNNQLQAKIKRYNEVVKEFKYYQEDETITELQERIKKFTKELEELRTKKENSKLLLKDFKQFRETHYNQDVELLLRDLKARVNFEKVECKQEGTIEDYNKYFKTKILEN